MARPTITAQMIVKNDDQWVWYAIQSVLLYVDRFLIIDTGSTDHTVGIIQSIKNTKVKLSQTPTKTPEEIVSLRQSQLKVTRTDWLWLVDADEVYPEKTTQEIITNLNPKYLGIIVKRYDLLGDIYHYQPDELVGGYKLFGQIAHHSLRLINTRVKGLHLVGTYPNEAYVDNKDIPIVTYPKDKFYFTHNRYHHMTYLRRSSLGARLANTLHRVKYKVETGKMLESSELPEVLSDKLTGLELSPFKRRGLMYEAAARLITPFKIAKRSLHQ